MIDFCEEVIPGKSAKGYKDLKHDEWFFKVHWANDPNMPGMLQIESLVQLSALALTTLPGNKGKVVYLISADNLKFLKKVTPNNKFTMNTKIINFKRGIANVVGKGFINNQLVCSANFKILMPDELKKFKVNE